MLAHKLIMMQVKQLLEQLPGQCLMAQEQQEMAARDSSQLAKALLDACEGATEATAVEVCPLSSATLPRLLTTTASIFQLECVADAQAWLIENLLR